MRIFWDLRNKKKDYAFYLRFFKSFVVNSETDGSYNYCRFLFIYMHSNFTENYHIRYFISNEYECPQNTPKH